MIVTTNFISGMAVGIEYVDLNEGDEDFGRYIVIDLFIIRFVFEF